MKYVMRRSADRERREDIRTAYLAAVQLMIYDGQAFWQRCGAMFVTNSIVLAITGLSKTDSRCLRFSRDVILGSCRNGSLSFMEKSAALERRIE
ncbi:hypothetical protein ACFL6S_29950 [Candidatus Poribacteria bacterium]